MAFSQIEEGLKSKNKAQRKKAKEVLRETETTLDIIILSGGLQGLFECERCGKCCTDVHFLYLFDADVTRIAEFLKISNQEFIEKYTNKDGDESKYSLQIPCPFYDEPTKACTIYDVRPDSCVEWPASAVGASAFQGNAVDWEHKVLTLAAPACCLPFASRIMFIDGMEHRGHFRFMKTKELPYAEKINFYLRSARMLNSLMEEEYTITEENAKSWGIMRSIAFFDLIRKGWNIRYDVSQPFAYMRLQLSEGVENGKKEYKRLSIIRDQLNSGEIDLKTAIEFT